MGKCMKCGNYMPWDTGMCTSCRNAIELANARKVDEERKKRQAQQPQPRPESATIRYSFTDILRSIGTRTATFTAVICKTATATAKENGPARRINTPTTATGT